MEDKTELISFKKHVAINVSVKHFGLFNSDAYCRKPLRVARNGNMRQYNRITRLYVNHVVIKR